MYTTKIWKQFSILSYSIKFRRAG